ncbi:MAG: glycosyltransferase [Acidimicrobiia bacterium]|nr:glycosyltransferase [Acidimicrobiia bacterium]
MSGPPEVSVVLCTRDRAQGCRGAIDTVRRQDDLDGVELVVVDNASVDGTRAMLERLVVPEVALTVVDAPVAGLGRARNRGVEVARGELIVFLDDDCRWPVDHLRRTRAAMSELGVAWLAGAVHAAPDAAVRAALVEDPGFRYFPASTAPLPGEVLGANLAVRAAAYRAVGGCDERLGAGTPFRFEDVELCARLADAGHDGAYLGSLAIVHAHGRDAAGARRLEIANALARGAYLARRISLGDRAYARRWAGVARRRFGWRAGSVAWATAMVAGELAGLAAGAAALGGRSPRRARSTARPARVEAG